MKKKIKKLYLRIILITLCFVIITVIVVGKKQVRHEGLYAPRTFLTTALWAYCKDVGAWPHSLKGLMEDSGSVGGKGPYLKGESVCLDSYGTPWAYSVNGTRCELRSAGRDRRLNSEDDVAEYCFSHSPASWYIVTNSPPLK